MIAVACVWVEGNVPYSVEYVQRLRAMVARHLTRPHVFYCLTDRGGKLRHLPDVHVVDVPRPEKRVPGWWSKVECFRPDRFSGRVLYLDLDVLVTADLAPIVDYLAPFALIPDAGHFTPPGFRQVVKRFNSSVMVWDARHCDRLHDDFTDHVPQRLWGDQDWIGEQMPTAATMPLSWFPRLSEIGSLGVIPDGSKVILSKKPKNAEAARKWPWFDAIWRAAA